MVCCPMAFGSMWPVHAFAVIVNRQRQGFLSLLWRHVLQNSTRLRTRDRVLGPPVNCCMIHLLPHSILLLFLIHHILSYIEVVPRPRSHIHIKLCPLGLAIQSMVTQHSPTMRRMPTHCQHQNSRYIQCGQ